MNFFKSILSDDPDPTQDPDKIRDSESNSPHNAAAQESDDENETAATTPDANSNDGTNSTAAAGSFGGWKSFGGLIKTFATRSESVIETYRRDLQEFGSGLRKETELFREVASRAVKELPASIEVGASVAHGSLESVSHAIDGVFKSTAGITSQGKETTAMSHSDVESDTPDTTKVPGSARYNRFDAQLNAIQSDMSTFTEEPEDMEDYKNWKLGFQLAEKDEEIENLIGENGVLEGVYAKVVPIVVDNDSFWCRYFYRVHKLKQQESVRANLVKRAISIDDEEELSWDVDDDDENLQEDVKSKGDESDNRGLPVAKPESTSDEPLSSSLAAVNESGENNSADNHVGKGDKAVQLSEVSLPEENAQTEENSQVKNKAVQLSEASLPEEKAKTEENSQVKSKAVQLSEVSFPEEKAKTEENSQVKNEEKVKVVEDEEKPSSGAKGDQGESGKDSDISIVSSQQSVHEEQDLEWDEIEDIGSGDEKKANPITQGGSPNRADVRKQLSTAEEDEELTWDIDDED